MKATTRRHPWIILAWVACWGIDNGTWCGVATTQPRNDKVVRHFTYKIQLKINKFTSFFSSLSSFNYSSFVYSVYNYNIVLHRYDRE